ncbi:3' terminal RNA ribose 2'-O-methyltransferase Hen1 [Corynebacterium hansenii]|uniref:Small RNA 2'-O-methyltransferase n=1 Tax=Corynebacterium hansenii TaxID=394964 RepID=A0ABV7ZR67_9CORY|nr:3' terminal RNA ribose 2'-O-methyltransferase Hen1 [Corynebacterium hansenii]WJZ00468.1 RNA repair, ligase-Pnkp-associating, region of Hen1 [Corynebacterium hansenii]
MHFELTVHADPDAGFPVATDAGFLLGKHPQRVNSFTLPFGIATVAAPHADDDRLRIAMWVDVSPADEIKDKRSRARELATSGYVSSRPHVAGSLMSTALSRVFRSAMAGADGVSAEYAGLAETPLPLELTVAAVGSPELAKAMFSPMGWRVRVESSPADERFPEWGDAPTAVLRLSGRSTIASAISQLYVLLPVLEGRKHFWVGPEEAEKMASFGGGWLAGHPELDTILFRGLARQRELVDEARRRLGAGEKAGDRPTNLTNGAAGGDGEAGTAGTNPHRLRDDRIDAITAAIDDLGAQSVLEIGCGEGRILAAIAGRPSVRHVVGIDPAPVVLERAKNKLGIDEEPDRWGAPIELGHGSALLCDTRFPGKDAIVFSEVLEHLDPIRWPEAEQAIWGHARPRAVIVTTPNAEYNVNYPGLAPGEKRHPDHRVELDREGFARWCGKVADAHGYSVDIGGTGKLDAATGHESQVAVFTRTATTTTDCAPEKGPTE